MSTALHPPRSSRHKRNRPGSLSALAQLIAGEIPTLSNDYQGFTLLPDRSALLVDCSGTISAVRPAADGLYDIKTCLHVCNVACLHVWHLHGDM